jgi:hypothetical protein
MSYLLDVPIKILPAYNIAFSPSRQNNKVEFIEPIR